MCVKFHFPSLHIYFTKIILIMICDALSQRAVNGRLCHIHYFNIAPQVTSEV